MKNQTYVVALYNSYNGMLTQHIVYAGSRYRAMIATLGIDEEDLFSPDEGGILEYVANWDMNISCIEIS